MHHPTDRIAHTTAFVTPVVEHWHEREIAQWVHPLKDRSDDRSQHERTPTTELHLARFLLIPTFSDSYSSMNSCFCESLRSRHIPPMIFPISHSLRSGLVALTCSHTLNRTTCQNTNTRKTYHILSSTSRVHPTQNKINSEF